MGGRVEGEFFDALPEATDDSEDALRHGTQERLVCEDRRESIESIIANLRAE